MALVPKNMREVIDDLKGLAAYSDDPQALIEDALRRLRERGATRIDLRMAAEEASLAMTAAVEKLVGRSIRGDRALQVQLGKLTRRDRGLPRRFNEVRTFLHQDVFYQDDFKASGEVIATIGGAKQIIQQILDYSDER